MSPRQFHFYATAADLSPVLSVLEAQVKLQYSLTGLFETSKPETYLSYADIPNFARPHDPSSVANRCYLVSFRGTVLHVRNVPQRAGGVLYAIDQKLNEESAVFLPGGRYRQDVLLYGEVSTIWNNNVVARNIYDSMARLFRERFSKLREYLVGPEALDLAKAGVRLALSVSTPPELDLKP